MNSEAKIWLKHKMEDEIMGHCFNISNICYHVYDPFKSNFDGRENEKDIKNRNENINRFLDKISFLLYNFSEYINVNNLIEEYFSRVNTHWNNTEKYPNYKNYINLALAISRNEKLSNILE